VGALAVLAAAARVWWTSRRAGHRQFPRLAVLLAALVLVQVSLGAATVLTSMAVVPTTAHVAVGAAILALSFLNALRAWRTLTPPLPAVAPAVLGDPVRS
jgi:heme A synthase